MLDLLPSVCLGPRATRAAASRSDRKEAPVPVQPVEKVWMDGELVGWDEARIPVLTHSLHYGTGVFEGIRAYRAAGGTAVFRLHDHVRRLFRSAHLYHMDVPFSLEAVEDAIRETVRANGL